MLSWLAVLAEVDPIDRETARDAAEQELSKRIYKAHEPGLVQRAIEWVIDKLNELLGRASSVMPGGLPGLLLLVVLVVAVVVLLRVGLGPLRVQDLLSDRDPRARLRTADDHREQAAQAAAAGDFREAVRARFRAVIRELEQRGVLDQRAGRTAGEIAAEAGLAMPSIAADVRSGADLFNEIWYGGRQATEAAYQRMVALDALVGRTRQSTMAAAT